MNGQAAAANPFSGGAARQRATPQQPQPTFHAADMRQRGGKARVGLVRGLCRRAAAFLKPGNTAFPGFDEMRQMRRNQCLLLCVVAALVLSIAVWVTRAAPEDTDVAVPRDYAAVPRTLVAWRDGLATAGPVANVTSGLAAKELHVGDVWYATRDTFGALTTVAWLHDLVVATGAQVGVPLSVWVVRVPPDVHVDGVRDVELSARDVQRVLRRLHPDTDQPDASPDTGVPEVHMASPEVLHDDGLAHSHGHAHTRRLGDVAEPTPLPESEARRLAEAHAAAAGTRYLLLMNLRCEPHAATMSLFMSTQQGVHGSTFCPGFEWQQTLPHDVKCTARAYYDDATQFGLHDVTFTVGGEVAAVLWFTQEEVYVRPHACLCNEVFATHGCTTRDAACAVIAANE